MWITKKGFKYYYKSKTILANVAQWVGALSHAVKGHGLNSQSGARAWIMGSIPGTHPGAWWRWEG